MLPKLPNPAVIRGQHCYPSRSKSLKLATSRMSAAPSRVVAYLPSLRTILQRLRATSATPSSLGSTLLTPSQFDTLAQPPTLTTVTGSTAISMTTGISTDALHYPSAMVSAQLHPQFPLPGGVSLPSLTTTTPTPLTQSLQSQEETIEDLASSFLAVVREKPQGTVEMLIQECPTSLLSGFMKLFPGVETKSGALTVITLSERTRNDMTGWSPDVEKERDLLLEHFIDSAKEICSRLTGAGLWADFIDPSSGRAFYSPYSHNTLFETDDRFHYLGFEIDDLGCCKCVHHPVWGPYTFIGTIFTDAPTTSPILKDIMDL